MVGILIAGHAGLGRDLLRTARMIMGRAEKCAAISVDPGDSRTEIRRKFTRAVERVETEDGVLLLTDIFGGTASNVACELEDRYHLRVVTGVNLPMILEMLAYRRVNDLDRLAGLAQRTGKKSIIRAERRPRRKA